MFLIWKCVYVHWNFYKCALVWHTWVGETILTLIFFFFLSSKIIQSLSLSSEWLRVVITSGSPSWPYKQHDVLINCTSSSLWDTFQYAVCIVVMSHPLVSLSLCLMMWLQWILRNFSELFLEAENMILFIILTTNSMWYLWMTQ